MSSVSVNPAVCEATGFCAQVAPALFTLDDTGGPTKAVSRDLDDRELADASEAENMCPTRAIRVRW